MRVVVCGGRGYRNAVFLFRYLDALHAETPITHLMQGGATGADALAREWAKRHPEITRHVCKAAWDDLSHPDAVIRRRGDGVEYDAKAGHRRNARMIEWEPDLVVAFPGHNGTADMVRQAEEADIPVRKVHR